MKLLHLHEEIAFPAKAPPAWASRVDRWTQLDAAAFALPEAFWRLRERLPTRPRTMLLSGFGASNPTDRAFAAGGAVSPTKFVHTLPNIRASAMLMVMGWEGPVYSLHRDPCTLAASFREGLRQAARFAGPGLTAGGETWIWHVSDKNVHLFALHVPEGAYQVLPRGQSSTMAAPEDSRILDWFSRGEGVNFDLSETWGISRG